MPQKSFYLDSYSRYLDILWKQSLTPDYFIDHDKYSIATISGDETDLHWFVFKNEATDFTTELINSINAFSLYMKRLNAWYVVFSNCRDSEEQEALLIELIYPIVFICINKPYSIRSQFIYATTHLLHLSNLKKSLYWKDKLITDDKYINFRTLEEVGNGWTGFCCFCKTLNTINNEEFKKNTLDFRNKSHHAIPPELEFGLSPTVWRTETKNGEVSYNIGGNAPLKINKLINLLRCQQQAFLDTFSSYWKLMEEQIECWKRPNNTEPPNESINSTCQNNDNSQESLPT